MTISATPKSFVAIACLTALLTLTACAGSKETAAPPEPLPVQTVENVNAAGEMVYFDLDTGERVGSPD